MLTVTECDPITSAGAVAASRRTLPPSRSPVANGSAETAFFNNMLLSLDHYFLHRERKIEGEDGNQLNEVRVLSDSLTDDGTLAADSTIRLKPEESVSNSRVGDELRLTEEGFPRLAGAFLVGFEPRY